MGECIAKFDANKLLPEIYKEFLEKKKNVKTGTFRKEWAKSMNRKCTEEETQMADSILKNMSNPSVIRGKQIVTAVRYCSESVTQANIKLLDNPSCQWGCGHVDTPSCTA